MSISARQLVELTEIKPFPRKAVLLHIADTVHDGSLLYFRSLAETAKRLSTTREVVRRHVIALSNDSFLTEVGEIDVNGGKVTKYALELSAIIAMPCIHTIDDRLSLLGKACGGGGDANTGGEVTRTPRVGVENPTNSMEPKDNAKTAENRSRHLELVSLTREVDPNAHLTDDEDFKGFISEMETCGHG